MIAYNSIITCMIFLVLLKQQITKLKLLHKKKNPTWNKV